MMVAIPPALRIDVAGQRQLLGRASGASPGTLRICERNGVSFTGHLRARMAIREDRAVPRSPSPTGVGDQRCSIPASCGGKFTAPGDHWNKFYNLWFIPDNRWTKESRDNKGQDPDKPFKLTIEEVIEWAIKLIDDKGVNELDYDIREVGPGNRGILVSFFQVTKLTTNVAAGKLTSQQQKNELEKAKEMAFFRASTPDNCPKCGAPANRCTYHPQVKTH